MSKQLAIYLVFSVIACVGSYYGVAAVYDEFQYASEEAQTSLEVTEEQTAELKASSMKSDSIAYGIISIAMVAACGLAANPSGALAMRIVAVVLGALLGAVAGYASAQIGHYYDTNVPFPRDPVFYWVGRWILILLPVAIASGVVIAISGNFAKQIVDATVGSILGAGLATIIYCFTVGAATRLEGHEKILPAFPENRMLLIAVYPCIGLIALLLLARSAKPEAASASEQANASE